MGPIFKKDIPNRIVKTIEPNNEITMTLIEIKNDRQPK